MKFLVLYIFVLILKLCVCRDWSICLKEDLEYLEQKIFEQQSYPDVTKLWIYPYSTPDQIESVEFQFLEKFPNLQELNILLFNFASVKEIKFVSELKTLELANSKIENLEVNLLKNLVNLEVLGLHGNEIQVLCQDFLKHNQKLTEINFSLNKIQKIPQQFLKNLQNLQAINFRSNQLKFLPPMIFQDNRKLKSVDFRFNLIQKLDPEMFNGLNIQKKLFFDNPCAAGGYKDVNLENCFAEWRNSEMSADENNGKLI